MGIGFATASNNTRAGGFPLGLRLGCLALLTAWSGCAWIPPHERPVPPVANRFPGSEHSQESGSADIAWRDFFLDSRLQCLMETALDANRDLHQAALRVEQAREQFRVVRAAWMPRIQADGSMERTHQAGNSFEQWSAHGNMSAYELDLFGRIRSLNTQALAQVFANEEARRSIQIALAAEVATQYFALLQARAQIQVAYKTLESAEDLYRLTKVTFEAGATHELDVRTSQGQVQTVRASLVDYQLHEREAANALELLLGKPPPPRLPPLPALDTPHLLAPVSPGLPSELVLRRADILQAEHSLRAARANVGAARAAFFPSIRLTASMGTVAPELTKLFAGGGTVWRFAPDVTLPIFTGGQNRATLRAAHVGVRLETARYEKAIQTAFREVADALASIEAARKQISIQREAVSIQERRLELASARYRAGEDAYVNVLLAQQALYAARQARWNAQFRWLAAQVALYRALGGGWR